MRPWVSAFLFVGVGLLLSWVAAARIDGAWLRAPQHLNGNVMDVDTRVVSGTVGRTRTYVFQFEGHAGKFAVTSPLLPRPTSGQLLDAGHVIIDYDGAASDPAFVVTGLTVDGRVYFTPLIYGLAIALSVLVVLVPGVTMLGIGGLWLYRLCGLPLPRSSKTTDGPRRAFGPVLVYSSAVAREASGGDWLD